MGAVELKVAPPPAEAAKPEPRSFKEAVVDVGWCTVMHQEGLIVGHNIFGILGDDESEDPTQLFASKQLILQVRAPSLAKKASTTREPKNDA